MGRGRKQLRRKIVCQREISRNLEEKGKKIQTGVLHDLNSLGKKKHYVVLKAKKQRKDIRSADYPRDVVDHHSVFDNVKMFSS